MHVAVVALLASLLVSAGPPADDPSVEVLVDRLQAATDRLDTLQADFVQSLHSMALGEPQRESGVLYLQRPTRMRWEYRDPEEKLAVVDGERSWLYIPAEGQVFVGSLEEAGRGGAGLLLAARIDLRRDFTIQATPAMGDAPPVPDSLTLFPREPTEEFERIDVVLAPDSGLPRRIAVHGALGDIMQFDLRQVRTGLPLEPALFRFDPPPGVEVVPVD